MKCIAWTCALALMLLAMPAMAAEEAPEGKALLGVWYTQDKEAKVEVTEKKGVYEAKIIWLKEPRYPEDDDEAGVVKHDRFNPDKSKRNKPVVGLVVLRGLRYAGDGKWKKGKIYDPKNGKTYKCEATLVSENKLHMRGFIGISLIGRTTEWARYLPEEEEEEEESN